MHYDISNFNVRFLAFVFKYDQDYNLIIFHGINDGSTTDDVNMLIVLVLVSKHDHHLYNYGGYA